MRVSAEYIALETYGLSPLTEHGISLQKIYSMVSIFRCLQNTF